MGTVTPTAPCDELMWVFLTYLSCTTTRCSTLRAPVTYSPFWTSWVGMTIAESTFLFCGVLSAFLLYIDNDYFHFNCFGGAFMSLLPTVQFIRLFLCFTGRNPSLLCFSRGRDLHGLASSLLLLTIFDRRWMSLHFTILHCGCLLCSGEVSLL